MYRTTIGYHERVKAGRQPIPYALVQTALGWRAYGAKALGEYFDADEVYFADGSYDADGSITAGSGSAGLIERAGRLLAIGGVSRKISPITGDVLAGYRQGSQAALSLSLDNVDRYFSKMLPKEPFLGAACQIKLGFEDLPAQEHLTIFTGEIQEIALAGETMEIEACET